MEASSFKDFRDKLGKIDPDLDLYVLIHGLSCEVKKIASQDDKTDLQKGAESDQVYLIIIIWCSIDSFDDLGFVNENLIL